MKSARVLAATALMLLVAATSHAAPILVAGSTYSFYLSGEVSGNPSDLTSTVDGVAETFTRAGLTLTLNETDTDLGNGSHLISIRLSANGDLFPAPGEGAIVGVGGDGNGLNLLTPVHLADARIRYFIGANNFFTSNNLADDYRNIFFQDPWSGFFAADGVPFIVGNSGGRGIDGVQLDFTVTPVPEPATLALLGLGLSGLAARRRKR